MKVDKVINNENEAQDVVVIDEVLAPKEEEAYQTPQSYELEQIETRQESTIFANEPEDDKGDAKVNLEANLTGKTF